jgi:hypothetical protein
MKRWKIILISILAILGVLGAIVYHNTFGFTAKKKYENCAKTCEKVMINESNIPACKLRCEEITSYSPSQDKSTKKTSPTPSGTSSKSGSDYYVCEWSWPQKVLNKDTGKIAIACPKTYPWCHSKDLTENGAGCCETVNEQTMQYSNCKTIAELQEL